MRKLFFFLNIVLIISIFSGCSDVGVNSFDDNIPVKITSVAKGGVISAYDEIPLKFGFEDSVQMPDTVKINVTDPSGKVLVDKEAKITDKFTSSEPFQLGAGAKEGLYRIQFDFYTGDELFYTEIREFFVSVQKLSINCINSYPPVLYPEGGGLFDASVLCNDNSCWLRWAIDGDTITEGLFSDGYQSIQIEAPETEGVYQLSLEVFPFAPENENSFNFTSNIIKTVPVYVNKNQKAKENEYGSADAFFNLFHFRGSFNNSSDSTVSGIDNLQIVANPKLSVKNGFLGYYIDDVSGFTAEKIFLPIKDGQLQASSLMMAIIPSEIKSAGQIFSTAYEDESFQLSINLLEDGKLKTDLSINGDKYSLQSETSILSTEEYTSFSISLYPTENDLQISIYKNGIIDSEAIFKAPANKEVSWFTLPKTDKEAETIIFGNGCFEGLIDELGVYYKVNSDGKSIDPKDFRRAQLLKYGKQLMYANSFDDLADALIVSSGDVKTENGLLIIPPGTSVDFPQIYPGKEEVNFTIALENKRTVTANAHFFADNTNENIVSINLSDAVNISGDIEFSIIFNSDKVAEAKYNGINKLGSFDGDYSGVVYRIVNNNSELPLKLESILIIRNPVDKEEKTTTDM